MAFDPCPTATATHHFTNPPPRPIFPLQLSKPHDLSQGVLYPVISSAGGFIPKSPRSDHPATVPGPGGYPHCPLASFPHQQVRPIASPRLDSLNQHPMHMMRKPQLHHPHLSNAGGPSLFPIKGSPVSAQRRVVPHPSSVSDCNGCKNLRDRRRNETLAIVRDRKVRITDGASLYALCRSWLRNGYHEESQPQYGDFVKSLPKPVPKLMAGTHLPKEKEGGEDDDEKKEEGSVELISAQDLLKRLIKRAKKVRAGLREERLQRIARYRTRLALLLPPFLEQYRNDTGAGN